MNKLFLIELTGGQRVYAIAEDPTTAYNKVRKHLDETDRGFTVDRGLRSATLLAEDSDYHGKYLQRVYL
jgi:hypothetical protein